MRTATAIIFLLAQPTAGLVAQAYAPDSTDTRRVRVEGYGIIDYAHYAWDTEPGRPAILDLERLVVEGVYSPTPKLAFEAEVEFEHGGTGSSVEIEPGPGTGVLESAVEKGGEIVLEELHVTYALASWLDVRAGHFYVPVGYLSSKYKPSEYPTVFRPGMETTLLPAQWDETGVKLMARRRGWRAQLGVVNGLDNSRFGSARWIGAGKQRRLEQVRAENLAGFGRLDLLPFPGLVAGVSGYVGNSTGNRPQLDLAVPAYVTIGELHADYDRGGWRARGMVLRGWLQNSAAVSAANSLSSGAGSDPTPVAAQAAGWSLEAGYDVLRVFRPDAAGSAARLDIFGRYEWYDSMYRVAAGQVDDPRWQRRQWTLGLNWRMNRYLILKAEYADRWLGLPAGNHERTLATGLGAEF
ncbi:MAG TPA: hypothetical protein VNH46_04815 [Gemmatimonadales bacterium]|nr:hypothetical protein [Gemmatimonadales bacterium]